MNNPPTSSEQGSAVAWLIYSLAALAFGYAFFQRVAPSVMVSDLQAEFAIGAAVVGTLSALYFYPYVVMQIPLGVMIDRWGARLLLTLALGVSAIGSAIFALAQSIEFAYAGRLLIGIGCAVGFLGSLAIASRWFPPHRFAFFAGLTMFVAMMSGIMAQGPLSAFVESYGWRAAHWGMGGFALALALAIVIFVRNAPPSAETDNKPKDSWAVVGRGFKRAVADWGVWKIAIVASTMSGPMLSIGALWGTPFLISAYGLDKATAAFLASFLLLGWAFSAPFAGWLSDYLRLRKALLVGGSFSLTLIVGVITFAPTLPLYLTVALFVLMGVSGAFMAICFALVREVSAPEIGSSVTGIVNSMTVASGAVLQPAVGYVLDLVWNGDTADGAPVYLASDFQSGFVLVFLTCLLGFVTCLLLKETPVWKES